MESLDIGEPLDVLYLDPPYNQHPYGSNYFMLNVIAENKEPERLSKVSGIPTNWNKSAYNSKATAIRDMEHLLRTGLSKSRYIVLSYNDEGIISTEDWAKIFEPYDVEKREILYDTFKGSRNLKDRSNKVVEIMYIISKK
jgi:adenine-specific DNA-methyltransferase